MTVLSKKHGANFLVTPEKQKFNFSFFKNQRMTFIAIFVTTERGKFWVEKSEINEWKQRLAYYAGDT